MITASKDGTVRHYAVELPDLIARARQRATGGPDEEEREAEEWAT